MLANYSQTEAYFKKLDAASDRAKLISIGKTEEGRDQFMMIVTSPENHKNIEKYKEIAQKMARAEDLTDAEAKALAAQGKAVVWMIGDEVARVTARKDQYGEVKEFICNECRFDKKDKSDWTIEGPRHIDKHSVISANHYEVEAPAHTPLLNKA